MPSICQERGAERLAARLCLSREFQPHTGGANGAAEIALISTPRPVSSTTWRLMNVAASGLSGRAYMCEIIRTFIVATHQNT